VSARTGRQRHALAHGLYRLHLLDSWCAHAGLPEFDCLAGTDHIWWPEVPSLLQPGVRTAGTAATIRIEESAARTVYASATSTTNGARYGSAATYDHVGPPPVMDVPVKSEEPVTKSRR